MGAFLIVKVDPFVQIGLQSFHGFIELFAERYLVKFLQNCLVEPFADAVGLGRFHLGFGVVDIVDCQEELVIVLVDAPAIFRPAIGQNA